MLLEIVRFLITLPQLFLFSYKLTITATNYTLYIIYNTLYIIQ